MDFTAKQTTTYQIAGAAIGLAILWASRDRLSKARALPGIKNTASLATAKSQRTKTTTSDDLKNVIEYDYIIVGTGTAGCVLANRLSEDVNVKVLAIEAGHSDLKQLMSRIPAGVPRLFNGPADWAFKTTPQPECNNRELSWPRGKMIGGSSSINAMMYMRGAPDDYNEWERLGNKGWSYKDVLPYMKKAEGFRQPKDSGRQLSKEDLQDHGTTGPWSVGYSYDAELTRVFPDACTHIGVNKVTDVNTSRGIVGAAPVQTFIDPNGQRSSTAVAYLTADVVQRPNLKIASGQVVTRIIFDQSGAEPRAVGIEMASSRTATRYLTRATKEVLVCSGTVGTPQLLKLSGIGPASELKEFDIPLVKNLSGVGENLMDHMAYHAVTFKTDKDVSLHYLLDPLASLPAVAQWFKDGTGPMTSQACGSAAFIRTSDRDDAPASLKMKEHISGPTSADLELISFCLCFADQGRFIAPLTDGYGSISAVGLRPESRGTVKLSSNDPFAKPLIDPRALSSPYDLEILLYGVKLACKIAKSEGYKKYFRGWYIGPQHPVDWDTASDEEIKDHIRKASETLYHPMGTAKMGSGDDAVVDDQLRVRGVGGLRVVDASIVPVPLACHPCAPVVMIAEKAADLIKGVV